ncbi:TetR/AcrR family transcriptional regulator [Streptomyces sp. AC555_RSS877]|uniref:TetR/AcrR family transcriptional regulator n=1 Tax=Streptomyces sp. AC555_RSS877 TaxID=2823688 RepID=UPI001C263D0E|nr:TetR/AcrR family transcriptional regulator [Streptomyces sp. AC555_RSS877]
MSARSASADRPGTGKSAPYHHGDLRRALTDAALDLIGERGPKGFTLTEVARRAGVSTAAPYRHFTDKSDLLATVAELGFQRLHDALRAAPEGRNGRDHVIELGRAYLRWALDHPDFYLVMFGAEVKGTDYPGLGRAAEAAFGVLLKAVEAARDSGTLPAKDARALAGSLWAVVHGAASLDIGGALRAHVEAPSEDLVVETITALTAP